MIWLPMAPSDMRTADGVLSLLIVPFAPLPAYCGTLKSVPQYYSFIFPNLQPDNGDKLCYLIYANHTWVQNRIKRKYTSPKIAAASKAAFNALPMSARCSEGVSILEHFRSPEIIL